MKSKEILWKMASKERLVSIVFDIYRELYKKAVPSASFDELIESGIAKKPNFFMKYYLPQGIQDDIMEKHIKKNKLTYLEAKRVRTEIWLGSSPRGLLTRREKR